MHLLGRQWTAVKSRALALTGLQRVDKPRELPDNPLHDDLYLVEFPKSGVTWLCFLMANVNLLLSRDEQRNVTFFNLHAFIPEVNVSPVLNAPILPFPGFRILKSHAPLNLDYARMFYLVRDPRDVMASYHAFLNQTGWFSGSLAQVVAHEQFGIASWIKHVSGWLDNVPASRSFALLRYEDLLTNTSGELKALYRLIGFELSDELVARAIERSSMEQMRATEREANARHPANRNMEFVRSGSPGGPRETLLDEVKRRIEQEAAPLMKRLGYVLPE
jgi:hypothetical protein